MAGEFDRGLKAGFAKACVITDKEIENAAMCIAYAEWKLTWGEMTTASQAAFRHIAKEALEGAARVREPFNVD